MNVRGTIIMSAYQDILVERKNGIVVLSLNRPEKLNAMTADMGE
jgi:enoyl-CoA hydratase/carnithine racemase